MDRLHKHETFLCKVVHTKGKKAVNKLIKDAQPTELDSICEVVLNILKGVVPLPKEFVKKAEKYKTILRRLAKRCMKKVLRKKMLIKYFCIIRDIIAAVLPILGIIGCLL
jgi:hypothetical protein